MNIVVLLASPDQEFEQQHGYPRPLVEIKGIPIIQRLIMSFKNVLNQANMVSFVIRKEHNKKHYLGEIIKLLFEESVIIELDGDTQGAACSTLLAIEYIDPEEPLFVISADEIVDLDLLELKDYFDKNAADGGVIVFESIHPRFSYVRCAADNLVIEAAEKRPISNKATVGYYYYSKGKYCINSIESMITKGASTQGKYFLCPAFNEMILSGKKILAYPIEKNQYHPLKSFETIKEYQRLLEEN